MSSPLATQAVVTSDRHRPPFSRERFLPAKNQPTPWVKPHHGLWTSTWEPTRRTSAWVDWCVDNEWIDPPFDVWHLVVSPTARILTIDSLGALCEALTRFPAANVDYLDFEQVATQYDAIHLTEAGQQATHRSHPDLYGWDCESTLWLHWAFDHVEHHGVLTEPSTV